MEVKRVGTQPVRLTPIERSALAYIYAFAESKTQMAELEMPTNIHQIYSMVTFESLYNLGLINFGKEIDFGGIELPLIHITDFGRALARKHGLSSEVHAVPKDVRTYKYTPSHVLNIAINAMFALLAWRGTPNDVSIIESLTKKLNSMTISLWRDEWNNIK